MTRSAVSSLPDDLKERTRALIKSAGLAPLSRLETAGGGGNSRLYRAGLADGTAAALKVYPGLDADPRDRLATEFGALAFLHRHGLTDVPRPLACDDGARLGLYEWIEGERPAGDLSVLDAMSAFDARLLALGRAPDAAGLPLASEACLSPADLVKQVEGRLEALAALPDEPELEGFLSDEIRPLLARAAPPARALAAPLDPARRTLSASDFGWHNMLATSRGAVFLDFEYFGWDDPAKMACDVFWHPGMAMPENWGRRFIAGAIARRRAADPDLEARIAVSLPVYGLRWVAIVLNEFRPERWRIRRHAAGDDDAAAARDWSAAKTRQLDKARALSARVAKALSDPAPVL